VNAAAGILSASIRFNNALKWEPARVAEIAAFAALGFTRCTKTLTHPL